MKSWRSTDHTRAIAECAFDVEHCAAAVAGGAGSFAVCKQVFFDTILNFAKMLIRAMLKYNGS